MNKFDKKIHDRLEGYSSQVNKDLWNKISANLPVQEQSTFKHWWLAMFGVAVVFIGFSTYMWMSYSGDTIINENKDRLLVLNEDIPNLGNSENIGIEGVENRIVEEKANTNGQNVYSKDANVASGNAKDLEAKPTFKQAKSKDIFNYKTSQFESVESLTNQSNDQNKWGDDERLKMQINPADKNVASLYKQYNTIINKAKNKEFSHNNQKERLSIEQIELLTNKLSRPLDNSSFEELLERMNGKKLICPSFSNARFGIFIEGYFSNDIGLRELSYNGPISEVDYLNVRNQTENANYSYSAGMRLSFLLPMGIGAKTGVNYSQINETFKYIDPNSNKTQTVIIKEYIWENGIVTDSSETTKQISIPGSLNVVSQNKYKVIDIPLLFTYEWGYKKRMYYSVTAGPMFNFKFSQKGKFLNPETLKPVDFTTNTGSYKAFNTNVGTSVYLGFALNYQLGHGTDIFIEPNMRHYLNKTTLNSYLLNQKYTVVGIGFGVKHKI